MPPLLQTRVLPVHQAANRSWFVADRLGGRSGASIREIWRSELEHHDGWHPCVSKPA